MANTAGRLAAVSSTNLLPLLMLKYCMYLEYFKKALSFDKHSYLKLLNNKLVKHQSDILFTSFISLAQHDDSTLTNTNTFLKEKSLERLIVDKTTYDVLIVK